MRNRYEGLKKIGARVGTVALPAAVVAAAPLAAVPAGTIGIAIAALGYVLSDGYAKNEKDIRAVIDTLTELDSLLHSTEEALTNHERILSLLGADVKSVISSMINSQDRFKRLRRSKVLHKQDYNLLKRGVQYVMNDTTMLGKHYADTMTAIYTRMQARSATTESGARRESLPQHPEEHHEKDTKQEL